MKTPVCFRTLTLLFLTLVAGPVAAQTDPPPTPKYPALPSETPPKFKPTIDGFDFVRREVEIPMRDDTQFAVELRAAGKSGRYRS